MPNRIIKESICINDQIDQLKPFEEVFFYRLIVNADDYGRMDGRIPILRSKLFPLKTIRDEQIADALEALASVELVTLYNVHGKPFVRLTGWERNQSIRAKKSKYPSPDGEISHLNTSEINCMQMQSDECKCSRNPIQSESNPEAESKRVREASAAAGDGKIPDFNTPEAYAAANLQYLSPRNMEELTAFLDDLSPELIRCAIDEACANGKRTWAYTRTILNRYVQDGYKTVGDVQAAQRRNSAPAEPPVRWVDD